MHCGAALCVLVRLAERRRSALALLALTPYLNGILEFIDELHMSHARLVYRVFVALGDASSAASETVRSEMSILIGKQLNHSELRFKRLGVIGYADFIARFIGT